MKFFLFYLCIMTMIYSCQKFEKIEDVKSGYTLVMLSGNLQEGIRNTTLEDSLVVQVLNQNNQVVSSVEVLFEPSSAGSGSPIPSKIETDRYGIARTTWTLGGTLGIQRMKVTINVPNIEIKLSPPIIFETLALRECPPFIIDNRNRKTYSTVLIGNQCWMAENINFGTEITLPKRPSSAAEIPFANDTIEKYCPNDCDTHGGLYLWGEANRETRNICPDGWHIPSRSEWDSLITYINGGNLDFPDPLHDCGIFSDCKLHQMLIKPEGWCNRCIFFNCSTCTGVCVGSSGFNAIAAGSLDESLNFQGTNNNDIEFAAFWSSTKEPNSNFAWWYEISIRGSNDEYRLRRTNEIGIERGASVRCIKDN